MADSSLSLLALLGAAAVMWASQKPLRAPIVALAIPLVAASIAYATQQSITLRSKISQGEDLAVASALELLEDAFLRISQGVEQNRRSRIDWLIAARNIRIAGQLLNQVQDPAKKALALERELLYRQRIRIVLSPLGTGGLGGLPERFFADSPSDYTSFVFSSGKPDPIAESSLVVIYRFAKWPDGVEDVIEDDLVFSEEEIDKMIRFGPRNLGLLMARSHELRGLRPKRGAGRKPEDFNYED